MVSSIFRAFFDRVRSTIPDAVQASHKPKNKSRSVWGDQSYGHTRTKCSATASHNDWWLDLAVDAQLYDYTGTSHYPDWDLKSFVSQTRQLPKIHTGANCARMGAAAWCASDSMLIASVKSCCPGRLEQDIHQYGYHILFMESLSYWPKIQILPTLSETDQHAVYATLVRNIAEVALDAVPRVQILI